MTDHEIHLKSAELMGWKEGNGFGMGPDDRCSSTICLALPRRVCTGAGRGEFEMSFVEEALEIAMQAHAGQVDKCGEPYILHPLRVGLRFLDDTYRIVGFLHDVSEDSQKTFNFGPEINEAVDALTRRENEQYMAYIGRCGANKIARSVKIADLEDNTLFWRVPQDEGQKGRKDRYYRALSVLRAWTA